MFRDNNEQIRRKFFTDPLIKYVWSKIYIVQNPEVMVTHLRQLRSEGAQGEAKYSKLTKHILHLEVELNFKILPDISRHIENLPALTE